MRFSWFAPKAEPKREPRVRKLVDQVAEPLPTVDYLTAEAAQQLLENTAFDRVISRLRAQSVADFSEADPDEVLRLQKVSLRAKAIEEIAEQIRAMADELKLHQKRRDREKQPQPGEDLGSW